MPIFFDVQGDREEPGFARLHAIELGGGAECDVLAIDVVLDLVIDSVVYIAIDIMGCSRHAEI